MKYIKEKIEKLKELQALFFKCQKDEGLIEIDGYYIKVTNTMFKEICCSGAYDIETDRLDDYIRLSVKDGDITFTTLI